MLSPPLFSRAGSMRIRVPARDGSSVTVDVEPTSTVAAVQQDLRRSLSGAESTEACGAAASARRRSPAISPSRSPSPRSLQQRPLGLPPSLAAPVTLRATQTKPIDLVDWTVLVKRSAVATAAILEAALPIDLIVGEGL